MQRRSPWRWQCTATVTLRNEAGLGALTDARHAGREFDEFTRLYYNRAREYDPATGRFQSPDPLGFAAGDANLYRYAFNSPTHFTDPSGLIVETPWDLFSLGVGVVSFGWNLARAVGGAEGAWYDVGIDGLGIAADTVALLLPGVPGGAGLAIKATRAGKAMNWAVDAVNATKFVQRGSQFVKANAWAENGIRGVQLASAGINAFQGAQGIGHGLAAFEAGDYLSGATQIVSGGLGLAHFGAQTRNTVRSAERAFDEIRYSLDGIRARIDVLAQQAQARAWKKGLSGIEAGKYADRLFQKAIGHLNLRLHERNSEFRAFSQYGRNARRQEFWGYNRPLDSRFLDAVVTNADRTVVYSGWDIRFQGKARAAWNSQAANEEYVRLFRIVEGYVREISIEAFRQS